MSEGLLALAREALARRDEEPAIAALEAALGARGDARLWHALGELHRARDDSAPALDAMARAAELAPEDAAIAARRAAFARDAGIDAVALTRAALALAPAGDETRLGLAEALVAQAQVERAEAFVAGLLVDRPGWSEGQAWLARSRWMSGDPAPLRDLDAALFRQPSAGELWRLRIMLAMQAGDFAAALAVLDRADAAIGPAPLWLAHRAACLDELGRTGAAAAAFAALGPPGEVGSAVRLARHLLRRGEAKGAAAALERWLGGDDARHVWPYLALAWRLAGDRRAAWLDGDPRLTGVYDLAPDDVAAIAGRLRGLHTARRQPIDQSLRGGTQTGGYLFARLEPEYRALRRAVVAAVEAHVAALPPRDPFHPVLRMRRDAPVRFSGAWSVRLGDGGYHASHVHPAGWFSSALYLAVPEGEPGDLVLGQPEPELGLDLPPLSTIAPRPGRLVLFPSMLWHGTRPFAAGERLTVAFDVAPPP